MKEINEEMVRLNIRIGELQAEIKINEEKYSKDLADEMNAYLKELINKKEAQCEILRKAENIILGIE